MAVTKSPAGPGGPNVGPNKFKAPLIEPFSHQQWFLSEGPAGLLLSDVIYYISYGQSTTIDPEGLRHVRKFQLHGSSLQDSTRIVCTTVLITKKHN